MPTREKREYAPEPPSYKSLVKTQEFFVRLRDFPYNPFANPSDPLAQQHLLNTEVALGHMIERYDPLQRAIQEEHEKLIGRDIKPYKPSKVEEKLHGITIVSLGDAKTALRAIQFLPQYKDYVELFPETPEDIEGVVKVLDDFYTPLYKYTSVLSANIDAENLSRREMIKLLRNRALQGAGVLVGGSAAFNLGRFLYDTNWSDDANKFHHAEQAKFEATHVLGTSPSKESKNGWAVQYVPHQDGVSYKNTGHDSDSFALDGSGENINFSETLGDLAFNQDLNTNISSSDYTKLNGQHTLKLTVDDGNDKWEYLLPIDSSGNMKNSIVLLANARLNKQVFVHFYPDGENTLSGKYGFYRMDILKRIS